MINAVNDKLRELKIEEEIWIIYLGIILLSFYSNQLERNYFLYNNDDCKIKYREVMITIFTILLFIYLYFFYKVYKELKTINQFSSKKKKDLIRLSFVASLLLVISGIIYLYIAIVDNDIDIELAFN